MENTWVDFKAVKHAVSIKQVADHYGLKLRPSNPVSFRGACPLPCHGSKDSKYSFTINTAKNAWSCLSASCVAARKGAKGGNILDMVALIEGCTVRDAACKIAEWFSLSSEPASETAAASAAPSTSKPASDFKPPSQVAAANPPPQTQKLAARESQTLEENKPLAFELKGAAYCDYLSARGVTKDTAEYFGVGLFTGRGTMNGRIVIPIHNEHGQLVAYAGRAVDDTTDSKYKFPAGFHKSLVLYNLHRVLSKKADSVILVEGFFGLFAIEKWHGFAVSLMGSSMSKRQEDLLAQFKTVTLLLDGDKPGRDATTEIAARLVRRCFVRVVELPEDKQPDHLPHEEMVKLLAYHK